MNEMEVCASLKPRPSCPPLHNVAFASHLPFHETATLPALPPLLHSFYISFFPSPLLFLSPTPALLSPASLQLPWPSKLGTRQAIWPIFATVVIPATIPNRMMSQPQWPAAHASPHAVGLKKRRKDSSKAGAADKRPRHQQVHQMTSCAAALPSIFQSEDDHSTISISRPNLGASLFSTMLSDGLSAQISKQQDDIIELLKIQTEQLRLVIEEKAWSHSKAFLANVGEWLSCKLRDRNAELERVNQKNLELEEKVNYLSLETRAWQSKAWSYDAMAGVLRANLQQVLMQQSRCQGKMEGCGDSDDDAASAIVAKDAQQTRVGQATTHNIAVHRACKACKSKETSVLLLPCLHLSLCSDCKEGVERCPTCNFYINECVEVYLS